MTRYFIWNISTSAYHHGYHQDFTPFISSMNVHVPGQALRVLKWGASLMAAGAIGTGMRVATDPLQNHTHRTYPIDKSAEIYRREKWSLFWPYTYVGLITVEGQCCMECGYVTKLEHKTQQPVQRVGHQFNIHNPWLLTTDLETVYQGSPKPENE